MSGKDTLEYNGAPRFHMDIAQTLEHITRRPKYVFDSRGILKAMRCYWQNMTLPPTPA